jgi:hypothetical protein
LGGVCLGKEREVGMKANKYVSRKQKVLRNYKVKYFKFRVNKKSHGLKIILD